MNASRINSFNENFLNESELDANSMMTELDKGLRSSKIGEQCDAIVRFPKLFEKYPFPILINSSFLKLAEFFRTGSNLLRLWVLRVCQQSEKHLEKILNIDEFLKRIFTVIHSNDPIARALTLKTLGAFACIIPEKQQVHHAIRKALDSHDTVEVEAAIHASVQFAAQSKSFAISMCSKVASMIESLQTPISMKLQLIPVLRHMHHDANTAALVKTLCINLLPQYPSEAFVIEILTSLSHLSCATLVDIPDQVNLLLTYLQDPRKKIRFQVLRSLKSLAEKGAHLWPKSALTNLLTISKTCNDVGLEQSLLLSVILILTKCPVTCHSLLNEENHLVLDLCSSCLVLDQHTVTSKALGILTSLVSYCYLENKPPPESYLEQINIHLEGLIYSSLMDEKLVKEFCQYLRCGVQLSEKNLEFRENFLELIGGLLTDKIVYPTKHTDLMCETLGALCSHFCNNKFACSSPFDKMQNVDAMDTSDSTHCTNENLFHSLLPQLLKKLEKTVANKYEKEQVHFVEILSAVCLQSMLGYFMPQYMMDIFDKVCIVSSSWTQYRIARSASRFGQHFLAAKLYTKLSNNISLEKYNFFLTSLSELSKAECILNYGFEFDDLLINYSSLTAKNLNSFPNQLGTVERLEKSITLYWKALASLKASSSPNHPLTFQAEFIRLRGTFLEALFGICIARNTAQITPAPAIAQTLAQNSRDHLQKFGHITNQLRKCNKQIKICEDMYSKIYKSAFDADPCTLEYLEIIQYLCGILCYSLELIGFVTQSEVPCLRTKGSFPETKYLINTCLRVYDEIKKLPNEVGNMKTITNKHTDVILSQIDLIIRSPLCMPRFFYQVLQSTSIKLALNPQRTNGDAVIVQQIGSNLVVKVEGVIQHYGNVPSLYRSIDSIHLTLISQLLTTRPNELKPLNDTITLTQTVKPHRDFLSGSFLLPLNNNVQTYMGQTIMLGGQWQVTLEACVIDKNGVLWNTGPKSVTLVRVPEDTSRQPALTQNLVRRF